MGLQAGRHPVAGVTWPVGCKLSVTAIVHVLTQRSSESYPFT